MLQWMWAELDLGPLQVNQENSIEHLYMYTIELFDHCASGFMSLQLSVFYSISLQLLVRFDPLCVVILYY